MTPPPPPRARVRGSIDSEGDRDASARSPRAARPLPAEVRIPNRATYWPVSPIDVVVATPVAARLLLGATPVGRFLQAAALGAYVASAIEDYRERRAIRRIDFRRHFGADVDTLLPMPPVARAADIQDLTERANDEFTPRRVPRAALAIDVDGCVTEYIAGITGQRVLSSVAV